MEPITFNRLVKNIPVLLFVGLLLTAFSIFFASNGKSISFSSVALSFAIAFPISIAFHYGIGAIVHPGHALYRLMKWWKGVVIAPLAIAIAIEKYTLSPEIVVSPLQNILLWAFGLSFTLTFLLYMRLRNPL